MAEERIAERIDSNLLNVAMSDLPELPKMMYQDKIKRLEEKTQLGIGYKTQAPLSTLALSS